MIREFLLKIKEDWDRDIENIKRNPKIFIKSTIFISAISLLASGLYLYLIYTAIIAYFLGFSIFPVIFWSSILILGFAMALINKNRRENIPKYLAIAIGALLTLQTVYPVFAPKVSFSNFEPIGAIIQTIDENRKDFVIGLLDVKVEPALFPNAFSFLDVVGSEVELPLAVSNIEYVEFDTIITPTLFSNVVKKDNVTAHFFVRTDGWIHKQLEAKIKFTADTFKRFDAYVSESSYMGTISDENNFNILKNFYSFINFRNDENFFVCFRNYEITFDNTTSVARALYENRRSYSVALCDNAFGNDSCQYFIQPREVKLSKPEFNLTLENFCLDANETVDQYLIFKPLGLK